MQTKAGVILRSDSGAPIDRTIKKRRKYFHLSSSESQISVNAQCRMSKKVEVLAAHDMEQYK